MNRNILGLAVQAALATNPARRYGDDTTTITPAEGEKKFDPAVARTALVEYGHAEEAVKGMKDEDVQKLHDTVSKAEQKRIGAALEKTKGESTAAAKAMQEKWTKGELKLELPKDSKLHQSDVDEIAAIARERGLSQDVATAMLQDRAKAVSAFETRQIEAFKAQRGKWIEEIKADKDLGGEKLAETQRLSMLAIERFVPPELREQLRVTGFGDNPIVVKMLVGIGKAMDEDKPGVGGRLGGKDGEKKDAASVLYDNTPK